LSVLATSASTNAGEARGGLDLPRRDVLLWVCAIIFLNQLFASVNEASWASPELVLSDIAAVGFFQLMAWYAVFRLLASSDRTRVAQSLDFLIASILCLLLLLPTDRAIWVAATVAAVVAWICGGGDPKLRAAGTVLAAISSQKFWGHVLFSLFALPLLRAEAAVVGTILQVARPGTVWKDNVITLPNGHGVVVYSACSSFHNLTLALLCWVTVISLRNQNWQIRDLKIGCAVGATMVLCNVARLCLMAWNADLYHYWHDGDGAQIFAIGASVLVLIISLYGSRLTAQAT
jgi:hypothetical protein